MKKTMFVGLVMAAALAACGGKAKTGATTVEKKADGSAAPMGGATYGSAAPAGNPCGGEKNPCGGM